MAFKSINFLIYYLKKKIIWSPRDYWSYKKSILFESIFNTSNSKHDNLNDDIFVSK